MIKLYKYNTYTKVNNININFMPRYYIIIIKKSKLVMFVFDAVVLSLKGVDLRSSSLLLHLFIQESCEFKKGVVSKGWWYAMGLSGMRSFKLKLSYICLY